MSDEMLAAIAAQNFQVRFESHAQAILGVDFPDAMKEIDGVLASVRIPVEELVRGGGGEAKGTQRLRNAFAGHQWRKTKFELTKSINGVPKQSISHEIDHVRVFEKGTIALEIEWNNKDPFFDRDLENFKRLHAEGAISVGIIVTRGSGLQDKIEPLIREFARQRKIESFDDLAPFGLAPTRRQRTDVEKRFKQGKSFAEAWSGPFCADKYGQATTHWRKLMDRIARGVGNPCPLLLIGIPDSVVTP